jgi:hypothetical protein
MEKMPSVPQRWRRAVGTRSHRRPPRTVTWFAKYAVLPDHLKKAFEQVSDIPVDIQPIYSFAEEIR